ncbi:MAG: hypothetical protein J7K83_02140 [Candidatus Aenigmarchaeota archaeon]|nr:hypothetical protein [Candidatus Aenigmarchaeota archaeon]
MKYSKKNRAENQKYKVFLDECVLLDILFGSFLENLRKNDYELIKYKQKEYRKGKWQKISEKILSGYTYEMYDTKLTANDVYKLVSNITRKYKRAGINIEFYTTKEILNEVEKRIKKVFGKKYSAGLKEEVLKNIEEIKDNGSGYLYPIEAKTNKLFFVKTIEIKKKNGNVYLNYPYKKKRKSFRENEEYEKATMRRLFIDPDDKDWLDAAYYSSMNMILTLDTRIVKYNSKVHRFIPIINVLEFDDAIKIAKEYGWKKLKLEVEERWKERNIRYSE